MEYTISLFKGQVCRTYIGGRQELEKIRREEYKEVDYVGQTDIDYYTYVYLFKASEEEKMEFEGAKQDNQYLDTFIRNK